MKAGRRSALGAQRYRCQNPAYGTKTFMLKYRYKAREPAPRNKSWIGPSMVAASETPRGYSKSTKTPSSAHLKKAGRLAQINPNFQASNPDGNREVRLERVCETAELDGQWPFAGNKSNQRWLWYAVDHAHQHRPGLCLWQTPGCGVRTVESLAEAVGYQPFLYR